MRNFARFWNLAHWCSKSSCNATANRALKYMWFYFRVTNSPTFLLSWVELLQGQQLEVKSCLIRPFYCRYLHWVFLHTIISPHGKYSITIILDKGSRLKNTCYLLYHRDGHMPFQFYCKNQTTTFSPNQKSSISSSHSKYFADAFAHSWMRCAFEKYQHYTYFETLLQKLDVQGPVPILKISMT